MAAGLTEHGWSVRARWSYHVPPPRWTPPKQRGRPSHALKRLMERWCRDHGEGGSYREGKGPMNASICCMTFAFPCGDLGGSLVLVVPPGMQAWSMPHAKFRLCHVQPTAVLGRGMKRDLIQDASSLLGRKGVVQARTIVGVQIVLDQTHFLCLGLILLHPCLHTTSVILAGASCWNLHVPPASQGRTHHARIADALPCIRIVHACWLAWLGPLRRPPLTTQVFAGFVETDHRRTRIRGPLVRWDDIFHAPDEAGIGMRWDTPRFDDPWLHIICCNACRTVSVLIVSTRPKTTRASARSCKVPWHRPWADRCMPRALMAAQYPP